MSWADDEQGFLAELARGRRAEYRVAIALLEAGHAVRVGQVETRDNGEPIWRTWEHGARFADQADLVVNERHTLEVKSRALTFTGPDDFPFDTALIGSARRWKARTVMPMGVVIVSDATDARIFVPSTTAHMWQVRDQRDSTRDYEDKSVHVPRACLRTWDFLIRELAA